MFKPLEIVGDTARGSTDQKVRGSNPFERAELIICYFRIAQIRSLSANVFG
jgi:hypothetical protein